MFILDELQEWPEEDYPTYANGPGYIVSSDIAKFILSEFEKNKLRVCSQITVSIFKTVEGHGFDYLIFMHKTNVQNLYSCSKWKM